MKGIVEIYKGDELISSSQNLVVDGASEVIVDIFSKATTGIRDNAQLSSILDTSNYTIQALSFGKHSGGYEANLHTSGDWLITSGESQPKLTTAGRPYYYVYHSATAVDIFIKPPADPIAPNPIDRVLALNTNNDFGHNINAIQFSSVLGLTAEEALFAGCYAPSEGIDVALSASNTVASGIPATNHKSEYNLNSSMDRNGFINITTGTDAYGKFVTSANTDASTTGEVSYMTKMNGFDLNFLELYGGVYHIGLWALDLDETLQNSGIPPYSNVLATPTKRFKLFAKKTLTSSLTGKDRFGLDNTTGTNPERDLYIIWRVIF